MRTRRYEIAAILGLLLVSTKAQAVTERQYIDSFLSVPQSVMNVVGAVLPEKSAAGNAYISSAFDPNLVVTETAKVAVTFLHEGAGYRNSLGYFTYHVNGTSIEINDRQLVFPNASYADPNKGWGGGTLQTGDTVTLRDSIGNPRIFQAGERIGFFLVSNGWDGSAVKGWTDLNPAIPSVVPSKNASFGNGAFTSLDELNPEYGNGRTDVARHIAMLRIAGVQGFLGGSDFFMLGFEDQRRDGSSDNDFNDTVFLATSTPETAIATTNVQQYDPQNTDPDGDGVTGVQDFFPNDPSRAFVVRTPATGYQTIVFEDNYPLLGDGDFNDVVIQVSIDELTNATGGLKELVATFHLIARGAKYDHAFGLIIPGMPAGLTGSVGTERFSTNSTESLDPPASVSSFLKLDGQGNLSLRLDQVIPSTKEAFRSPDGKVNTNTNRSTPDLQPASVRVQVVFDQAILRSPLGAAPFDPYLAVKLNNELRDIHLVGKSGLPDRPSWLPFEGGSRSYIDAAGYPRAMLLPFDFRYPLERVGIDSAFGSFASWRTSQGSSLTTWYSQPVSSSPPRVTDPLGTASRIRNWTLLAGH